MNVYVVYEDNGCGGTQVSEVFAREESLRKYLIKELNIKNADNEQHVNKMIDGHYDVYELVY